MTKLKRSESWESKLLFEVHDSLLWDLKKDEIEDTMEKVDYIMTEKIRKKCDWIILPLKTDWKLGKNWLDMKKADDFNLN